MAYVQVQLQETQLPSATAIAEIAQVQKKHTYHEFR